MWNKLIEIVNKFFIEIKKKSTTNIYVQSFKTVIALVVEVEECIVAALIYKDQLILPGACILNLYRTKLFF